MKPLRVPFSLALATLIAVCSNASAQAPYSRTALQNGTNVAVSIRPVDPKKTELRERDTVVVQVRFTDAATNSPLAGGSPAAWIDRRSGAQPITQAQCVGKVKRFAEGSTFSRTEMDLTSYFVVTMNSDPTLTVVDPRFGYGDTRLLAMVTLNGPGEDWALTADGKRLFVSVPASNEVVAVDATSWRIAEAAGSIPRAARVALQPDEAYLWVAYGGDDEDSGVVVLTARDLKAAARIRTGRGYHHLAFTQDSAFAFVSNPGDGTVTVIDVRKLAVAANVKVGARPLWLAYSDLAKAVYVANEGDGKIVAIDAVDHTVRATMEATPGLGQIRFAPGGRFALAVNPTDDLIYVVDASSNRIVQKGRLDKGPNQIAFTNKTAHIRHRGSDAVLMIVLATLGGPGTEISVADFSGGRRPSGEMARPTPADGIVQASGENGVLVANPGDKAVYLYMEGAAAPMGNLSNYGREPRAVLSIDRNLRESSPGVFETTTTLPAAGLYDLAVFLDRPRTVSCFALQVAADPALTRAQPPRLKVEHRVAASVGVGDPALLEFRLTLADTGEPVTDARDVVILVAGSTWQARELATHRADGVYSASFKIPAAGVYNVFLSSSSRGLAHQRYATVTVVGRPN